MSVIDLYEKLSTAPDERARAKIIAEAFETLEERYPNLGDMATRQDLRETELRLLKEIEVVRKEIRETEGRLRLEIEQVRADLKVEIEKVRAEMKVGLANVRAGLLMWSFLFWLTQFSAILLILWRVWPQH